MFELFKRSFSFLREHHCRRNSDVGRCAMGLDVREDGKSHSQKDERTAFEDAALQDFVQTWEGADQQDPRRKAGLA